MLDRTKKIAGVVFLTLLIWVWAYYALEEEIIKSGTLNISPDLAADTYISFVGVNNVPLKIRLTLKGPNYKIAELKKLSGDAAASMPSQYLEFFYDPVSENHTDQGQHTWDVMGYLQKNEKIKKLGLRVVDCDIKSVNVKIEKLVKKWLPVQVADENGMPLKTQSVEPAQVEMYVRPDYTGQSTVTLTAAQIEQARKGQVSDRPYVEFGTERKYSKTPVTVKMSAMAETFEEKPVQPTRIGFIFSRNLKDKYSVGLLNESDIVSTTKVYATPEAFDAYDKSKYQILIEIRDGDEKAGEITREVIYNFPLEYVRRNEIELAVPPREAKFTLVPLQQPATPQ